MKKRLQYGCGIVIASIIWIVVLSVAVWVVNAHVSESNVPTPKPVTGVGVVIQTTETPWVIPTGEPATPIKYNVPSDPGHGPIPVCQLHPGQGLAPGATCPPRR